ncbi:hypothetical protein IKG31_03335 [Candidatus Saccharibacteria bacterium]|nr:hypothetical protein [Candidatus Saccharibacteria bacterium]
MKKMLVLMSGIILPIVMCLGVLVVPSFADADGGGGNGGNNECSDGVKTALIGSNGCYSGGIWGILGIVIDILTIGIGAAAVAGIVYSGIQYTTASGDPAKITKAKRRLYEILIGILVYGVFYGLMRWLIPGWG